MNNVGMDIQTSKDHPPVLLPLHDASISDFSDIGDGAKSFPRLSVEKLDLLVSFDPLHVFHAVSSPFIWLYLTLFPLAWIDPLQKSVAVLATWHIRSKIRPFKRENSPNPPGTAPLGGG